MKLLKSNFVVDCKRFVSVSTRAIADIIKVTTIRKMKGTNRSPMMMLYCFFLLSMFYTADSAATLYRLRGLKEDEAGNKATEDLDDEMPNQDGDETMMINGTSATKTQQQQGLVDLVHLVPFDVQIAVTINMGIQTYEVLNIVTTWFNDAYNEQLAIFGYTKDNQYAEFNSVVLFDNEPQRQRKAQSTNNNLYVAKFRGGAVFTRDANHTMSIPENDVLVIQQNVLLNDSGLLLLLEQSTDATGLGEFVIDVNAFLNPTDTTDSSNKDGISNSSSNNSGLDVVIIVAIVIAIIAFLFLLGAIIWAYRFDRANRDVYLASNLKDQNTMMGSSSYSKRHSSNHGQNNNNNNSNDKTTSETDTVNDPDTPERIHRSTIVIEGSPNSVNNTSFPNMNSNGNVIMYPTMIGGGGGNGKDPLPMIDINSKHDGDDDEHYPESVISESVVSGSAISEDISTSLSQYYRAGMGKADLYGRSNGMLSDAGSVSSMESYGYSLDGGMSMAIPIEIPYQQQQVDRPRIGGLPIEPAAIATSNSRDGSIFDERSMDDVQIMDLDKELSNLDIKLLPKFVHEDDDEDCKNETYSDLEKYQLEDLNEMVQLNSNGIPTVVSTTSSTASKTSSKKSVSSKASSSKKSITVPIDTDSMMGTPDSDDDEFSEEILPKLLTDKIV